MGVGILLRGKDIYNEQRHAGIELELQFGAIDGYIHGHLLSFPFGTILHPLQLDGPYIYLLRPPAHRIQPRNSLQVPDLKYDIYSHAPWLLAIFYT